MAKPRVGIIMGSDSDLPVMQAAADLLTQMEVSFEMSIVSAHRTPARLYDYAQTALERGIKVIIAGAGGAAHLPGMVAAISPLPVIGVPVKSSSLSGQDSLLSICAMAWRRTGRHRGDQRRQKRGHTCRADSRHFGCWHHGAGRRIQGADANRS